LSPLSDEDTARLVAALLRRSVLAADTQAALLERAGGNPLYAEQFVRMHVDREDAGEDSLPETVQALIAARLDTLRPELKELVHEAAVVGKVFWTGALATMGGRSREDVLAGVRELVRREFVRPARVSSMRDEEEFAFWHVLVRDVAYQQVPRGPRAAKHVAAAQWIEQRAEDRVSDHAEFLVHHYEQALELARAAGDDALQPAVEPRLARFLILAGDRAMRLDMAAAEASYRRALELVADTPARAVVLVKLGDALQEQGKLRDARDIYEAGMSALRESPDERLRAVGLLGLGRALWRIGETKRSRELVLEAIGILEREPSADLVSAYEYAAVGDTLAGRSREGLEWADKGIAFAREFGVDNIVRHLQMRGLARIDLGDLGGIDDLREALDLSLRLGLGFETASAYNNLGEVVGGYENIRSGLELTDASREFARRRGMTHHVMWTRGARLWSLYELGEWDELLAESDELVRWDRAEGGTQIEVNALLTSAPVRGQRGDVERALADVALFLPRAREIADPQAVAPALTQAAFINALAGRLDDAVRLTDEFERASRGQRWRLPGLSPLVRVCAAAGELALAEKLLDGPPAPANSPSRTSAVLTARAVLAAMAGDTDEAAALFRAAAEGWEQWGSVVERAYALLDLGRCGDEEAAREAQAIFERLRARPFVALAA
jgi:tetratricopeptide (TPR) repeat protein